MNIFPDATPNAFRVWWLGLAAIVLLYAALSFYQINLPGLHYDEAFEAVPAVQLLTNHPVTAFRDSGITIGSRLFPLMTQDYIGTINLYGAMPFIAVFGSTPVALRSMSILFGAVTLILTSLLAHRLTGHPWVGVLAALLLSVDPTFIFWNRQGVFVTAVTATIGVGAAYCWLCRFTGKSMGWSAAGAFLFGLGLYAKFLFLWLIAALVGAVILLNLSWLFRHRNRLPEQIKRLAFPEAIVVAVAFLAGCWPLLLYNLQTGGTFLNISQNAGTSYYGVNNLAFGANLVERAGQFSTMLDGGHLWYLGEIVSNTFAPIVFVVTALLTILFVALQPTIKSKSISTALPAGKAALFPYIVIGLVILFSIGTVSALWVTHFAVLMPWPALAIAVGSWFILTASLAYKAKTYHFIKYLVWGYILLLVISNFVSVLNYHRVLSESGGLSAHSDAVYDLNDWLSNNAHGLVVAMDWGLAAPVVYLSHGRVNAVEAFGYQWQADTQLNERFQSFIAQPDTLYLWRAPDEIIFDRSEEFKALYRPKNLEETIEEAFYENSGRPILGVTRLVEKGRAANPPK